jgi:DNA polymerase-3 subunit alpha
VLKIAHHFAGLDLSEADILRRGMSEKSRSRQAFQRIKEKFFSNCKNKGYEESLVKEVWRQIESFAGYSFCKAHSASYAVESYQSLFLKSYYPLEFMVGVINNAGGFYRKEIYVHEARRAGATIEPPCVQHSTFLTTIQGTTIYLGFSLLKGLEYNVAMKIVKEREMNGPYQHLEDFIIRTGIPKEQLMLLIRINALRFTRQSKQKLMWAKGTYYARGTDRTSPVIKFEEQQQKYTLPPLDIDVLEEAFDQIELLGFPLISPFDLLTTPYRGQVKAKELARYAGQQVKMVGYFVTRREVWTKHNKLMNFMTWLDDEGNFFDTTHFPQTLQQYPFNGLGCYLILGKVVTEFDFPSLEVQKMAKQPIINDPRFS